MVLKDTMSVSENLAMENHRATAAAAVAAEAEGAATTFTRKRVYLVSLNTILLIGAFFICTLLAVSFTIYTLTACETLTPAPGEEVICTTVHLKHSQKGLHNDESSADVRQDSSAETKREQDVRLPRTIKPLQYNLTMVPHLFNGNFTFEGEVKIRIRVIEDCYNITMHATELNISKNDVAVRRMLPKGGGGSSYRIRKQYLLESKQFFIIELYDKLVHDTEYEISVKFSGLLLDYLQGFYRSSYQVGNETRWLASTQFQATDARRAFPCFDEPALKARFTLNIARPSNMSTISNMPVVSTRKHEFIPNYMWDHFAETLPMSTYLVAFAISDFTHETVGNFSVWARKDAISSAQYALKVGPKILKFLEEYFDMQFPLPKIDMIALPDFQAGAMENWGLITFRETTMLYEEGVSATTNKQRVASVVGHELAHQWFGNLVTPSWWTDIWLNEGFASYMEYLTVDAIEPEWKTLDQFVVNELQNVFQLDALSTSHKISVEVFNPDEISEIFDRISYAKGATIIRMMSNFLTSKVFRSGLSKYLKEMAYNSAEQDDLWRFLTIEAKAVGLLDERTTVKEIMDTWTLQMGYPVLTVKRHPHSNVVSLVQQRFAYVNDNQTNYNPLWWIPITYTTSDELNFENTRPLTWIPRTQAYEIENHNLTTADWHIFNIQQTGYYRTNYDSRNWHAITNHLMNTQRIKDIAPANRAQLIDDAMNLARGGQLPYVVALNLSRYLTNEIEHVPWKSAITAFTFIDSMFVNQGDYDLLKNYLLKLLTSVYNSVGFQDEGNQENENMLLLFKRVEILSMACHLGHRDCISECNRHFQNWIQVPNPDANNPISPNLRGIVYCTAIQYGAEAEWDFAYERYLQTSVSTEKELLLSALGCSKEPWILYRYLRRAIAGDTNIRKQDIYRVFASVSSNVVGQQISFDFIRNYWEDIRAFLGSAASNIHMLMKFATKRMNSKFMLAELESFVKNDLKDSGRSIKQSVEQVRVNVDWMNKNYKTIVDWLQKELKTTPKRGV